MIWLALARTGSVMSLAAAVTRYFDLKTREVKTNRIYSSEETARFLGSNRRTVVRLLRNGELSGKLVNGNYRISGRNIIEYLGQ